MSCIYIFFKQLRITLLRDAARRTANGNLSAGALAPVPAETPYRRKV
jgi:hypothetical protein